MATTYIPPSTTPLHLEHDEPQDVTSADVLVQLTTFLTSRTNIQPDVVYQLTELHKNVQWQVDGSVSELPVSTGGQVEFTAEEQVQAEQVVTKKKAAGKKKGGSKWA
ncbi:hypothetical protein HKX48_004216 [Thoreauomyces humboldtii]|nr:hypothetical protein HKX48_004216 [Thoreauomyces humboldtii]